MPKGSGRVASVWYEDNCHRLWTTHIYFLYFWRSESYRNVVCRWRCISSADSRESGLPPPTSLLQANYMSGLRTPANNCSTYNSTESLGWKVPTWEWGCPCGRKSLPWTLWSLPRRAYLCFRFPHFSHLCPTLHHFSFLSFNFSYLVIAFIHFEGSKAGVMTAYL